MTEAVFAAVCLACVGVVLGWFLHSLATSALREVWSARLRDYVSRLEESRQALLDLHAHYRADQARMLREIVTMRKLGFVSLDEGGDDEPGGTWVMDNEYEAGVARQRQRARAGEQEIRSDHADVIQDLGASLQEGFR